MLPRLDLEHRPAVDLVAEVIEDGAREAHDEASF
jgi:hypothetical protein